MSSRTMNPYKNNFSLFIFPSAVHLNVFENHESLHKQFFLLFFPSCSSFLPHCHLVQNHESLHKWYSGICILSMETLWGDVGEGSQKNQLELIQAKLETSKKNKPGVIPSFQAMLDPLGIQPSLNQRILQGKTFLQAKYRIFPLSNPIYWSLFLPKNISTSL